METNENFIYLLTHDGHRDSVDFNMAATSLESLKKLVATLIKEDLGYNVLEDTITIHESECKITFDYIDYWNDKEKGRCHYFKIPVVS